MGKLVTKKTLRRPLSLWAGAIALTAPRGSATARNRCNVQVIVRKDHRMRLSFLPEQLVRSSERLVFVDTKKVFRPCLAGFKGRFVATRWQGAKGRKEGRGWETREGN